MAAATGQPGAHRNIELPKELPVLPSVGMDLIRMSNDPDITAPRLAKVLEQDPALVAKVLRLANSAYYGLRSEVRTAAHAITLLGLGQIRTMALNFAFLKLTSSSLGSKYFFVRDFLAHSMGCAHLCEHIAKRFRLPRAEPDEAYEAGLLHDLGAYVLCFMHGEHYREVLESVPAQGQLELEAETAALGTNHCEVGGLCAEQWKLPAGMASVLVGHHASINASQHPNLMAVVQLGDYLVSNRGITYLLGVEPPPLMPETRAIFQPFYPGVSLEDLPQQLEDQFAEVLEETAGYVEQVLSINEQVASAQTR